MQPSSTWGILTIVLISPTRLNFSFGLPITYETVRLGSQRLFAV